MHGTRLIPLLMFILLSGCSSPKLLGSRSSQVVTKTTLINSRIEGSMVAEGIPHLPEIPANSGWTIGGTLALPSQMDSTSLPSPNVGYLPLASGAIEARTFLGNRWNLGLGLQANARGLSSAWFGIGKGFPISRAEGMIRLGAGLQRLDVDNRFSATTTRTDCDMANTCDTLYSIVRSHGKQEELWSPVGRLAFSLQPLRNGPWIDLQASTPLVFAEWSAVKVSTVMDNQYQKTDCDLLFGDCTDSTWTESESSSAEGEHQTERIATWSTGIGWILRRRHQQWSIGARWFPGNGTVQANAQWSVSFAPPSR